MKCRSCGKEAVGFIEKHIFEKQKRNIFSFFSMPRISNVYEAVCDEHMVEEEKELEKP